MATKRLIDPERYKTTLQRFAELLTAAGKLEAAEAVKSLIKGLKIAPTVDAVEVVHGRWVPTYHTYYNREGASQIADEWHCSECGIYSRSEWNYCPNCGADMRERKDNG